MTTIITPIAAGDAYDDVKAALVSLAEFWLGSGASSGGNTPVTWADIRTSLNAIATVLGVDTISNGDGGAAARAKINAINDLATLPSIGDLLTRFTTPASDDRAKLIGKLIYNLKDGGVWSKLDALWLTAAADAQAARRNWIADTFNLSAVNSPTFATDRGYTGNGSSSYLGTGFDFTTGLYGVNSASLSSWMRTNDEGQFCSIGAIGGTFASIRPRIATNTLSGVINNGTTLNEAGMTTSVGLSLLSRTASALATMYKDGLSVETDTAVATAKPTGTLRLLARSDSQQFSPGQIAAAHVGAGLSGAEQLAFYSAINTYLTAIGAA